MIAGAAGVALTGTGCAVRGPVGSRSDLLAQVRAAEVGFAATIARRDAAAFADFIDEDAVFINSGNPLRGRPAIAEFWKRFCVPPAVVGSATGRADVASTYSVKITLGRTWTH